MIMIQCLLIISNLKNCWSMSIIWFISFILLHCFIFTKDEFYVFPCSCHFRLDQILGRQGSKAKDVYDSKQSLASRIVKTERQVRIFQYLFFSFLLAFNIFHFLGWWNRRKVRSTYLYLWRRSQKIGTNSISRAKMPSMHTFTNLSKSPIRLR